MGLNTNDAKGRPPSFYYSWDTSVSDILTCDARNPQTPKRCATRDVEIHWVRNTITGAVDDFKFK